MQLSPAAKNVLRCYKDGMPIPRVVLEISNEERQEIFRIERDFDAKEHAEWAGTRLGVFARNFHNRYWLECRSEWARQTLTRKYLVSSRWLSHAMKTAISVAAKKTNDED